MLKISLFLKFWCNYKKFGASILNFGAIFYDFGALFRPVQIFGVTEIKRKI
jgi:hypothetical protein